MKKVFILLSCCLLFTQASLRALSWNDVEMSDEIHVTQRFISMTQTFDIATDKYRFGTVHRKLFSFLPQYEFYDYNDVLQAKAKMRWFSYGATFDVTDLNDKTIATVEEKILSWFPTFTILTPRGQILATAKLNFWETKYTVSSPLFDGPIAELTRDFLRFKDNWKIKILQKEAFSSNAIDLRVFMVVMAYQTDREYWSSSDDNSVTITLASTKEKSDAVDLSELDARIAEQQIRLKQIRKDLSEKYYEAAEKKVNALLKTAKQNSKGLQKVCYSVLQMIENDLLTPKMSAALLKYLEAMRERLN